MPPATQVVMGEPTVSVGAASILIVTLELLGVHTLAVSRRVHVNTMPVLGKAPLKLIVAAGLLASLKVTPATELVQVPYSLPSGALAARVTELVPQTVCVGPATAVCGLLTFLIVIWLTV